MGDPLGSKVAFFNHGEFLRAFCIHASGVPRDRQPGRPAAMVIGSNTVAAYAARMLGEQTNALSSSLARLSSGSRIVSPSDDPGGLAVSMKFSAEISRLNAAQSNVANALSYNQTQDGYLTTVDNALQRMSELATLSTDATKTSTDIAAYNTEFVKLKSTITSALAKKQTSLGILTDINDESKLL